MKIDFEMLKIAAARGANADVIIGMLEQMHARGEKKRKRDQQGAALRRAGMGPRQQATPSDKERRERAVEDDTKRQEATLSDNPRARLFREGTAALMTLGRTERAARSLVASWLKATHDDEQLVLATIMKAQSLAVADYAGWITSTLKGKTGNGQRSPTMGAFDDLITRSEGGEVARDPDLVDVTHGRP